MPAWIVAILVKLGIDLVSWAINYLEEKGVISSATAEAARIVHETKTYYRKEDFPGGVNGKADTPVPGG